MFVWKIAGPAGFGIMNAGTIFGKCFSRNGWHVFVYPEYPSLVRGGHNTVQVIISEEQKGSPRKKNDVVVALNRFAIEAHKEEINNNGYILYDEGIEVKEEDKNPNINYVPFPMEKIAREVGNPLMRNIVAIGASLALFDYPLEVLNDIIKETFGKKGEQIVNQNLEAAKKGYEYVKQKGMIVKKIEVKEGKRPLLSGNFATAIGAINAGLKFYSAYPMTPASSILHYMAGAEHKHDLIVKQTEDEIAAINMAIGASFAGARAMVATSGGGFALMEEAISLAGLSETPVTLVLSQRVGPSTGMPTWTEQADLLFAVHAGHGDFQKAVFAPGDIEEAYYTIAKALNFAEKYQIPVIVMLDKFLSESWSTVGQLKDNPIDRGKLITEDLPEIGPMERYKRYLITEDGVSPRPIPGVKNGEHVATSYEHRENGFSAENFKHRTDMVDKRARKIEGMKKDMAMPKIYGQGDYSLIVWGSQKRAALEAQEILGNFEVIHFTDLYPLKDEIKELLKGKKLIIAENNSTAQFAKLLRQELGIEIEYKILRYDGRPFYAEDLAEAMKKAMNGEKKVVVYDNTPYEYYTATRLW